MVDQVKKSLQYSVEYVLIHKVSPILRFLHKQISFLVVASVLPVLQYTSLPPHSHYLHHTPKLTEYTAHCHT